MKKKREFKGWAYSWHTCLHFMSTVSLQKLLVRVRGIVVVAGGKK